MRGCKGIVTELDECGTLNILFSNGLRFDFPFEAVGVASAKPIVGIGIGIEKTYEGLRNHDGPVPVTTHPHCLVKTTAPYLDEGYICNGEDFEGGCRGVDIDPLTCYHCAECSFDFCEDCTLAHMGVCGSADLDTAFHVVVLPRYGHTSIREVYLRDAWVCTGTTLPGGCQGGYLAGEVIQSQRSRYRSDYIHTLQFCKS
jgi:hypothetical protein